MRLVSERLHNQKLSSAGFEEAIDVVRWMGAVQAQDFAGAKWALALRMKAATHEAIERAFNEGRILRTHLMRPTWHFVAPEDIRWVLGLTAPRVNANCGSAYRRFELDPAVFKRTNNVLTKALAGGKHLTRAELRTVLNKSGVVADDFIRLAHIMIRAELDGIVCSGPRVGKQFTYALLEERVPATKSLARDEALAKLTHRYFRSHGPATLQDFIWWSGLTTTDAKRGVALIDRHLRTELVDDKAYFLQSSSSSPPSFLYPSHLLPAYDEYSVAYKYREAGLGPTVILDGNPVGTWKAKTGKQSLTITVTPSRALKKSETLAISQAANRYAGFLGLPAQVHI